MIVDQYDLLSKSSPIWTKSHMHTHVVLLGANSAISRMVLSPLPPQVLLHRPFMDGASFCCSSVVLPTKFVQGRPYIDSGLLYVKVSLKLKFFILLYRKILTSFVLCSLLFS